MALLTSLARVKAVASGDAKIQALTGAEVIVGIILERVAVQVTTGMFGALTINAQDYLAAHLLSVGLRGAQGTGARTSQTVGGVSVGSAIPWETAKNSLASTIYGQEYLAIMRGLVAPVGVYKPL